MFRYGIFQLKILSSENDCYEYLRRIQLAFESKHSKKTGGGMNQFMTEIQIYGENTACGIVMISANPSQIAKILYVNEELEHILGYKKEDVQGINVNNILPSLISLHHDRFI